MIVFDLHCDAGHGFEGWFDSTDAWERQRDRGLVECPMCGATAVSRRPSAPRLNLGAAAPAGEARGRSRQPVAMTPSSADTANVRNAGNAGNDHNAHNARSRDDPKLQAAQAAFYRNLSAQLRQMLERSDDVGDRFAEEARRIHYNEVPERQIHGLATREETVELLDEGIAVLPMPFGVKRTDELN